MVAAFGKSVDGAENNSVVEQLNLKEKLFYAPFLIHNESVITTVYNKKTGFGSIICVDLLQWKVWASSM